MTFQKAQYYISSFLNLGFKNWFQFYTISLLVLYGSHKTSPPLAQHYSMYLNCASYFQGLAMP